MSKLKKSYQSIQELLKDNLPSYSAKDLVLVKWLQKSNKLFENHLIALLSWWQSDRDGKQSLLDFLVQANVATPNAENIFKRKGISKDSEIDHFITDQAVNLITASILSIKEHAKYEQDDFILFQENNSSKNPQLPSPAALPNLEDQTNEKPPELGSRLGKCILKRLIGKGSTCTVFEGFHETLNIKVAIKVFLANNHFLDGDSRKQFSLEARTLAKLNHPYIVRVLDFEDGKFPFITLEYVEGKSLAELIEENGRIECRQAALIIYRCAIGLMVAHQNGIVHRDIKPANILISTSGEAKLTDLGLAQIKSNIGSTANSKSQTASRFNGTPAYAAPEQAFHPGAGDVRSDIYSLGATFYHAVTGEFPFEGDSVYAVVMKHINEALVPPMAVHKCIPLEISECILMMMKKKPEDRFQSIEDMLPELISFFLTAESSSSSKKSKSFDNRFADSIAGPITRVIFRSMKKMVDSTNKRQAALKSELENTPEK